MPASGELIRMMNFVDDIAATLRRIHVGITGMTVEERKRLSDYLRNMDRARYLAVIGRLGLRK